MDPLLQEATVHLAEAAVRNTAAAILDRVRASKARKDDAATVLELDQIINDLIEDKAELVRVANVYREALVAQTLSDEDILYVTGTVVPVLEQLAGDAVDEDTTDLVKSLITSDTVKILQILGFNFRQALGEPLTDLVRAAIVAKKPAPHAIAGELERLQLERDVAMAKLAADPDGFDRLTRLYGKA